MKKIIGFIFLLLVTTSSFISCQDDLDDNPANDNVVKNFIYKAMNGFYLYKPNVPVLANDRFSSTEELEQFHANQTPESFFESLVFDRQRTDRFSVLFNDYVRLEQLLSGSGETNGMEFGLVAVSGSATNVFGYVRYVLPNSSAATNNVVRGMIFSGINGITLTRENFSTLLSQRNYTINLANLNGTILTPTNQSISLTKVVLQEDPIFIKKVITQGPQKVGYLMYNGFLSQFDEQLNTAFAEFKSQGVTHLVLDLRYNGGGSVNTAILLGSLISGKPTTDVFTTEQWNPEIQEQFLQNDPSRLVNNFTNRTSRGTTISSLGFTKVHIITTSSTASASELVINGLEPYINVIQVGDDTAGKFQASITLYDSPNFNRANANPAHRYALQPLILKSINAAGVSDYFDGLPPDIAINEQFDNLGTLGDPSERLLQACLNDITLNPTRPSSQSRNIRYDEISGSMELKRFGQEMYKENF